MLVDADPERFFVPPYVGHRGWLGVRLDRGLDWDELAGIVEDAFAEVAPARLVVPRPSGGDLREEPPLGRGSHEPCRGDLGVGVLDDARQLVPVEPAVEANSEPAMVPVVGRDEEALRVGVCEQRLDPVAGGTPEREATVAVVVGDDGDERALAANEEGRRPVAWALLDLRQSEADPAQPRENAGGSLLLLSAAPSGPARSGASRHGRRPNGACRSCPCHGRGRARP